MKLNYVLSDVEVRSTGVHKVVCVVLFLFTLYTNDYVSQQQISL